MGALVFPERSPELLGDAPDRRVELLCEAEGLHATWSRFGPWRDGASPHIHHDHTDFFYVLLGEMSLLVGPERVEVPLEAGRLVRIPVEVVHGFRNGTGEDLQFLNLHVPGVGFADYMRGLRDGADVSWFDQFEPPDDGGADPDLITFADGDQLCDEPRVAVADALSGDEALAWRLVDGRLLTVRL